MLRSDIEKKLLESVKIGNDDYAKKKAINKWCGYYWSSFENLYEDVLDFIGRKLSEESSWNNKVTEIDKEKLDEKIIILKEGEENPIPEMIRYHLSCCSCNEKYIKELFFDKDNQVPSDSKELLSYIKDFDRDNLMIFWSHYINKDILCDKKDYKDGFEHAMKDRNIGAMEFFWKEIIKDTFISDKEEICIKPALYRGMNIGSNADMIEFSMKCLDGLANDEHHKLSEDNKYIKLLENDFERNKAYLTLYKLKVEYRFNSAKKLFKSLKSNKVSPKEYTSSMFGLLDALTSITEYLQDVPTEIPMTTDILDRNKLIKDGNELLDVMWHVTNFEEQKKYFIEEISAQFSPVRKRIVSLINMKRVFYSETLLDIVKSIEENHMERINRFDQSSATKNS